MKQETKTDYFNDLLLDKAVIIHPGEGERLQAGAGSCTFKITSEHSNNQLGIYELVIPPQTIGARLHYHQFMDETFIVNKGILTVQLRGKEINLAAGSVIYLPRFTAHGFSNTSDTEVKVTLIFNPSEKREGFFQGLFEILNEPAIDAAKFLKLNHKYDSFLVE